MSEGDYITVVGTVKRKYPDYIELENSVFEYATEEEIDSFESADLIPLLARSNNRDTALNRSIIPIQTESIERNGYSVHIIGATFHKSTGDMFQDLMVVGTGFTQSDSFDDGFARGFAFGLKNADANIANKDAYLTLYLRFEFEDDNTSQRDSIIPKLSVSGRDDKGASIDFIYFSHEDKYISLDYPYGTVILKAFYDSETLSMTIGNKLYFLDVGILKN